MPRTNRVVSSDVAYHVLNRAWGRRRIFSNAFEYQQFIQVLQEGLRRHPEMRIVSYCLMPNHWHLVLLPLVYGLLSDFMQWVEATHTARWNRDHDRVGQGGIYQGRFKSFPIEDGDHLVKVMRYVERNALDARLVSSAEQWHWGSLHYRPVEPTTANTLACPFVLGDIPSMTPAEWIELVNMPLHASVRRSLKHCEQTGDPFGSDQFKAQFIDRSARSTAR